jgi:PPOX class probable F420-dependent enzyme
MQIDTSIEFGSRVARRLSDERIIWLTTVRADGTPEPSPVWFLWDGSTFLIYSQPDKPKLRNIGRDPKVALNFNSDEEGGDVVVFTGEAKIDRSVPPANQVPDYVAKYRDGIRDIGMTPVTFAQSYSVPVRVTPTKLRGF